MNKNEVILVACKTVKFRANSDQIPSKKKYKQLINNNLIACKSVKFPSKLHTNYEQTHTNSKSFTRQHYIEMDDYSLEDEMMDDYFLGTPEEDVSPQTWTRQEAYLACLFQQKFRLLQFIHQFIYHRAGLMCNIIGSCK